MNLAALREVAFLMRSASAVTARRLRRGPLRPGWPWTLELLVHVMRTGLGRTGQDAVAHRAAVEATPGPQSPALKKLRRERVDAGGVPAEWFVPLEGASDPVVLYLHGGGYVFCSMHTHGELIARLALASGTRGLGIEYRLAPEHPFPAALDDALAAWRWLLKSGVDPSRVVLAGDSAGGGLAVALLLALRDAGEPLPAGAALLSPWVDVTCPGGSMATNDAYDTFGRENGLTWARWYAGKEDPKHPRISPAYADLRGLPPLFIQAGTAEVLRDDVCRFAETARAAGVKAELKLWSEMPHCFQLFGALLPEGQRATEEIGRALRAMLEEAGARAGGPAQVRAGA